MVWVFYGKINGNGKGDGYCLLTTKDESIGNGNSKIEGNKYEY
jgi:hypothetical protein